MGTGDEKLNTVVGDSARPQPVSTSPPSGKPQERPPDSMATAPKLTKANISTLIFALAIGLLFLWYELHIAPLMRNGLAIVIGSATVLASIRAAIAAFIKFGDSENAIARFFIALLNSVAAIIVACVLVGVATILLSCTSSVFVQFDGDDKDTNIYTLEIDVHHKLWHEFQVDRGHRFSGRPYFLEIGRPEVTALHFRLKTPAKRRSPDDSTFYLWRPMHYKTSEFIEVHPYILRIIPGPEMYANLVPFGHTPAKKYFIRVTTHGKVFELSDWRRQIVFAGAPEGELPTNVADADLNEVARVWKAFRYDFGSTQRDAMNIDPQKIPVAPRLDIDDGVKIEAGSVDGKIKARPQSTTINANDSTITILMEVAP